MRIIRESCPSKPIDPATLSTVGITSEEREDWQGAINGADIGVPFLITPYRTVDLALLRQAGRNKNPDEIWLR